MSTQKKAVTGCTKTYPIQEIKWLGYYGIDKNVLNVEDYDLFILESNNIGILTPEIKQSKICLAYVCATEMNINAWYYPQCRGKQFLLPENPDWPGTLRIDPRNLEWQDFFINTIVAKVINDGYDGLFLDSMDIGEWFDEVYPNQYGGSTRAVSDIIKKIKTKYPQIIISVNNSLLPVIYARECISYYIIESLISRWEDNGDGTCNYVDTPQESKDWLYPRVQQIQALGIPILNWEYGLRSDIERCNNIKEQSKAKGWHCFITDKNISTYPNPEELVQIPVNKYSFRMSKTGTNVNLFANSGITLPSSSNFKVSINNTIIDQEYNSLSFNTGDKVDIEIINKTGFYPPLHPGSWNSAIVIDYIEEILEPLPTMKADPTWEMRDVNNMFSFCTSLKKIPEGLFQNNKMINSCYYTFSDCSSLETIPAKVFENCNLITTFNSCFINCTSLKTIPEDLFSYSSEASVFTNCFRHTGLTSIPNNLFSSNTKANSFEYCFGECTSITSIPDGLFNNCTLVTNFSLCFYADTAISSVPENLFLNNKQVTTFANCFAWNNELPIATWKIGAENVTDVTGFVTDHWAGNKKVIVKGGSVTETTFRNASLPKMTIETY